MISQQPSPKAPQFNVQMKSELEKVLGDRQKLYGIHQKMNATYPKPQPPQRKVFSSRPDSVDL